MNALSLGDLGLKGPNPGCGIPQPEHPDSQCPGAAHGQETCPRAGALPLVTPVPWVPHPASQGDRFAGTDPGDPKWPLLPKSVKMRGFGPPGGPKRGRAHTGPLDKPE